MMQAMRTTINLPPSPMAWRLIETKGKVIAINPKHPPFIVESGNIIKEFKNVA